MHLPLVGPDAAVRYLLFCDGSSGPRGGEPGGFGWVICRATSPAAAIAHGYGGDPSTTNNRMELRAVIEGLRFFADAADVLADVDFRRRITVVSDSKYALDVASGSCAMSSNFDLGLQAKSLFFRFGAAGQWVRGHDGGGAPTKLSDNVLGNECADTLAKFGRNLAARASLAHRWVGPPPTQLAAQTPRKPRAARFFDELWRRSDGLHPDMSAIS